MKAGRGTPHGGVFLDIASRRSAEYIRKRLPSMYHQFKELAEVDITAEAMEVGPTCHYVMGGVEVDPDTEAARVPGLFAAGEVAGGMHGSNRLGGNSLSDLLVFGRRAGLAAASTRWRSTRPRLPDDALADAARAALAPFDREGGENPYTVQHDLQQTMHDLVGIIRTAPEMEQALERIAALKERVANLSVEGHRQYNPGWHLALDLPHMLLVSECIARAALERAGEPRRPHPRRLPGRRSGAGRSSTSSAPRTRRRVFRSTRQPLPQMPAELAEIFEETRMSYDASFRVWRGDADRRRPAGLHRARSTRARSCSTSSTGCRRRRPAISPSGGTARRASAGRAAPRSTAGRG